MLSKGFTGISYPFRVSNQGGIVTSTTSSNNVAHIEESIRQIFGTSFLERVMESDIYSSIDASLFEPNDVSLQQVIKAQIVEDLSRIEERIELSEDDVDLSVETTEEGEFLFATITFLVTKYQSYFSTTVKVGEVIE